MERMIMDILNLVFVLSMRAIQSVSFDFATREILAGLS